MTKPQNPTHESEIVPTGDHHDEALRKNAWQEVKFSGDLTQVYEYIRDNPDSPFLAEAGNLLMELKDQEINNMKETPMIYPIDSLLYYLQTGIFSREELIGNGVATDATLELLDNLDAVRDGLPDFFYAFQEYRCVCADGGTDVYFFGLPGTGKSSILTGLLGSPAINISYTRAGGPYAAALYQYLDAGLTTCQTPKGFVTIFESAIPDGKRMHHINLVEMSCEDLVDKLTSANIGFSYSFADLDTDARELLSNRNRKGFFLVVDPTVNIIPFNRVTAKADEYGCRVRLMAHAKLKQSPFLKKLVYMFYTPENASIMEKVDFIHIIVTKADTCGDEADRDEKARETFMDNYGKILPYLTQVCERYRINAATGGKPEIYTFSLGKFYAGGIYEYDETYSDKLVDVIKRNVKGNALKTFLARLRAIFKK